MALDDKLPRGDKTVLSLQMVRLNMIRFDAFWRLLIGPDLMLIFIPRKIDPY